MRSQSIADAVIFILPDCREAELLGAECESCLLALGARGSLEDLGSDLISQDRVMVSGRILLHKSSHRGPCTASARDHRPSRSKSTRHPARIGDADQDE